MKSRLFVRAVVLAAALAAPAAAQEKGPAITAQAAPLGKILNDAKAFAKVVAGPAAEEAIKAVDHDLKEKLGEKGFTGVDMTRNPVGYVALGEAIDKTYGVVAIPVTGEDEFLDLLDRVKIDADEVKGAKGLYELSPRDGDDPEVPIRLRFKGNYAYIGVNAPDAALAADKLVPAADILVPAETAHFAYRAYVDRYPEGLKKEAFDAIEKAVEQANDSPLPDVAKKAVKDLVGWYKRLGEQVLAEGGVGTYRLKLDVQSGEFVVEGGLTGRKGTKLAKEIAARKPTTNRFAGLIGDEAVGGFVLQLPLFAEEIRDAVAVGLKEGKKLADTQVPEEYKAVADEAFDGIVRTVKSGEFDVVAAVTGPDKDGLFGFAAAVSFEDTAKLEAQLRKLHEKAPEEIQNMIKLDAGKADGVSIHRVPVGLFLPAEAKKAFGDKASLSLAFAPKGIYVTFGPDSLGAMKAALAKKPEEAKVLDVLVNPARVGKLLTATAKPGNDVDPKTLREALGTEDKLLSVYGIAVEGGEELKVRFTMSLIPFARIAALGAAAPKPAE